VRQRRRGAADPAKPHVALATAATLDSIAATLASTRDSTLTVCVNQDGLTRRLNDVERRELDERVSELRALAGEHDGRHIAPTSQP
jgi:hypothetical protein